MHISINKYRISYCSPSLAFVCEEKVAKVVMSTWLPHTISIGIPVMELSKESKLAKSEKRGKDCYCIESLLCE